MIDLLVDLDKKNQEMILQENHIRILKEKIKKHKNEKGCNDISDSEDESRNSVYLPLNPKNL